MAFCRNNFPYYLDTDVQHYVIWSTKELNPDECKLVVNLCFPSNSYDVIIVETPQIYKSIQSARHVHVMVRPRKTGMLLVKLINYEEQICHCEDACNYV